MLIGDGLCPATAGMLPGVAEGHNKELSPKQFLGPVGAGKCKPETVVNRQFGFHHLAC